MGGSLWDGGQAWTDVLRFTRLPEGPPHETIAQFPFSWCTDMPHTRLRKFNTRDTYPDQSLDNDLCQAVVANGTVYLRGQVGTDFDGNLVGAGDPAAQTDQAMRNVEILLSEAVARLEDIVKITIFITRRQDREPVYRTVGKWLKGVFPVSTGLMVAGLAKEEWLMEIDVIAVIPKED